MTDRLTCTRCSKRLSRKTARLIDGKVMCSSCMFGPPIHPLYDSIVDGLRRQGWSRIDAESEALDRIEALRERQARDSDRSGEAGETGTGSTEGESAGPKGIAQPLDSKDSSHVK